MGKLPQQIKDGVIKTAQNLYWGINCDRDNFPRDVIITRKLFGKRNSSNANLCYQISISFSPEDRDKLTNEEVFRIAKAFAEKFFQGYEVLFAVHIDKPHPHAHFLIGNCHTETGKAFRRNEKDLYNMCEYLGEQCQQRGLVHSMREEYYNHDLDDSPDKETFAEKQMKAKGKETFKDELREVIRIECADPNNRTLEDVVNALMKHYHVECRVKGNTISYRHPEYTDKNGKLVSVRGSKLGDNYTVKGIEYELTKVQRGQEAERAEVLAANNERTYIGSFATGAETSLHNQRNAAAVTETSGGAICSQEKSGGITDAGGNRDGNHETGSAFTGTGRNRNESTGNGGGDRSILGGRSEGREGAASGNGDAKDVPTFEELFDSYKRRNAKVSRKRASEPEHTEPVRKKRKGIDR
ncbi:MAG: relaxase/mobilization nuclease domain-containing protein [Porcipelethomonas sp.]